MATEKTQALLTALRELTEWTAKLAAEEAALEATNKLEVRARTADLLVDIMSHLLAANGMERHARGECGLDGITRSTEAKLAADEPKN